MTPPADPDPMTTIDAEIRSATALLADAGIASAEVDAVLLAAHALGIEAGEVRRRQVLRSPVDVAFTDRFEGLVAERAARVPLQHITGAAHFRGLTLAVGPGVFVPRPETETLVTLALRALGEAGMPAAPLVVDLCTGSGAVALALVTEHAGATVHAVEVDPFAHAWARRNVERLAPAEQARLHLALGDARTAYESLEGRVDLVTCNPPYIPHGQVPVDPEVRDHDPAVALYGGSADGLALPLAMAGRAARLLRPGGVLVMEHADVQGAALVAALNGAGEWDHVTDHPDAAGRDRVVEGRRTAAS